VTWEVRSRKGAKRFVWRVLSGSAGPAASVTRTRGGGGPNGRRRRPPPARSAVPSSGRPRPKLAGLAVGSENGAGPAAPASVMVPVDGQPSDIVLPVPVAVTMLANLLARDDVLFTALLGEAMTGVRLAKVRARVTPEEREQLGTAGER
jgi:hypothetical protein